MLFNAELNYIDLFAKNERYFNQFVALIMEYQVLQELDWLVFQENFQVKARQYQN